MNSLFSEKLKYFAFIIMLFVGSSHLKQNECLASDLQLVMFTSEDCPVCQAWEKEIGSIYKKSQYQVELPLKRVDFFGLASDWISVKEPISGTPTFVVIKKGEEVGRILGYSGAEMFWWELSSFLE